MTLEPMKVTVEGTNPELDRMTRRLWAGIGFTLPILAVMVSDLLPSHPIQHLLAGRSLGWVEFAFATPVVLWGGWPFFQRGWTSILSRHLNMFTLISIGSGSAYLYSVVAVFLPRVFPASFRDKSGQIGLYFEPLGLQRPWRLWSVQDGELAKASSSATPKHSKSWRRSIPSLSTRPAR
jgi:Cu+-exporting ATPase